MTTKPTKTATTKPTDPAPAAPTLITLALAAYEQEQAAAAAAERERMEKQYQKERERRQSQAKHLAMVLKNTLGIDASPADECIVIDGIVLFVNPSGPATLFAAQQDEAGTIYMSSALSNLAELGAFITRANVWKAHDAADARLIMQRRQLLPEDNGVLVPGMRPATEHWADALIRDDAPDTLHTAPDAWAKTAAEDYE